jgi:Domain of unknown function (DUF5658)
MVSSPSPTLPAVAGRLAAVLRDRRLRIPLVYFVVAQLLDILTTTDGLGLGLQEANPLTASVLRHLGVAGLLAQKVPVVLALLAGLSLLPRRVALAAAWAFTLLMAMVVASNLDLMNAARQV